jgi:hypothetical protein
MVIACCGHEVTDETEWIGSWKDYTRECQRAVAYGVVCKACYAKFEAWGIVLHNEAEEREWLEEGV